MQTGSQAVEDKQALADPGFTASASARIVPALSSRAIPLLCVLLYLAVSLVLFTRILYVDHGTFTYTLDDPYIHLSLAENLAHGHYGINPGEPASPSSSILWPFLLVPFAPFSFGVYAPLALNLIFCAAAAWLIGWTVERWGWRPGTPPWTRLLAAVLLILGANLVGLTFIGMEHGLQVLLAIACASGLSEALAGRAIPSWTLAAAVLGPLVRYENLALTLAVSLVLFFTGRRRAAFATFGLSLVGPVLFSAFLLSRGLPALPSSILVKSHTYDYRGHSALWNARHTVAFAMRSYYRTYAWYSLVGLFLLLVALTVFERRRTPRIVLAAAALAVLLHLFFGQANWFYRYEMYCLAFGLLIAFAALARTRVPRVLWLLALLAFTARYFLAIERTPTAAANIYQQQYQMRRFLDTRFTGHIVAVNDIGLVSYHRPAGLYVLDLWGLASPEASSQFNKDAAWLDAITRRHADGLVILYSDWYPEGAPRDWRPLGSLCATGPNLVLGGLCTDFYSTPAGDYNALESELADFARTLPPGSTLHLASSASH